MCFAHVVQTKSYCIKWYTPQRSQHRKVSKQSVICLYNVLFHCLKIKTFTPVYFFDGVVILVSNCVTLDLYFVQWCKIFSISVLNNTDQILKHCPVFFWLYLRTLSTLNKPYLSTLSSLNWPYLRYLTQTISRNLVLFMLTISKNLFFSIRTIFKSVNFPDS